MYINVYLSLTDSEYLVLELKNLYFYEVSQMILVHKCLRTIVPYHGDLLQILLICLILLFLQKYFPRYCCELLN